jgi:rhodanese-related sulfurtransferase
VCSAVPSKFAENAACRFFDHYYPLLETDASNYSREGSVMNVVYACGAGFLAVVLSLVSFRYLRAKRHVETNSIEPDELHELLKTEQVSLYDVRQPLDFLAHPEIIPGAMRIPPKEIAERTGTLPRDHNSVIYCTGSDHETSKMVLEKARALKFTRVKILRGGLDAWKDKGYPVETYTDSFSLDTPL